MKKNLLLSFILIIVSNCAFSQKSETIESAAPSAAGSNKFFIAQMPLENKTDSYTITGIGNFAFSTSNIGNGSADSYNHAVRVTVPLTLSATKPVKAQLVFYSAGEKIQYAVTNTEDQITVYFPQQFYDDIKLKLEQALAAKKKIILSVTQKTTGLREAVLQF